MSYISVSDVAAEFKTVSFGTDQPVTSAKIQTYIDQVEALTDSEVGVVYSTPVPSTSSQLFLVMKYMCTMRVKARILDILPVKTGKSEAEQGGSSKELKDMINTMITNIRDKKMLFPSATLVQSDGGVQSYNAQNNIEPKFTREGDSW